MDLPGLDIVELYPESLNCSPIDCSAWMSPTLAVEDSFCVSELVITAVGEDEDMFFACQVGMSTVQGRSTSSETQEVLPTKTEWKGDDERKLAGS